MSQPECSRCGDPIEDGQTFVNVGGGTVHRDEPQNDAGGGIFHAKCGAAYIEDIYVTD